MTTATPQRPVDHDEPSRPLPPRMHMMGIGWLIVILAVVAVHVIAWRNTGISVSALVDGWSGIKDFFAGATPPDTSWGGIIKPGVKAALVTFYIGLMGTTLSIPFAFVLALMASRATTSNSVVYQAARSLLSTLRAIPSIVFALIFVAAVGLGAFPGVLALIFNNTGVMGKLWAEAMEESDLGPRDALRVGGASSAQVATNAVLPTAMPQIVGLLLYRLDVNVREALMLGIVGAGGIGFLIYQSIQTFRFDQMMSYIIIVLLLIVIVDQASAWIRRRIGA